MARCPESHKGVTGEVVKILLLGESNEQKQALLKAYCGDSSLAFEANMGFRYGLTGKPLMLFAKPSSLTNVV